MRIAITGWADSGKTQLAAELCLAHPASLVFHTDDYIDRDDYHACSETVSHLFDETGPWIIEGIKVPNALRKWVERNKWGAPPPVDKLIVLRGTWLEPTNHLRAQGRGHDTVLKGLLPWLESVVEFRPVGKNTRPTYRIG